MSIRAASRARDPARAARSGGAGGAEDALLAEAAALVDEATEGDEVFAETLAQVTEGVRVRAGVVDRPRHRGRDRRRRDRTSRAVPKGLLGR